MNKFFKRNEIKKLPLDGDEVVEVEVSCSLVEVLEAVESEVFFGFLFLV